MLKGAIISDVEANSIAYEIGLKKGDEIISINNKKPKDIIDYSFLIQDEFVDLYVKHENGEEEIFEIEKDYEEDLGISFEFAVFDGIKPCTNHCIFCFVDQQPKGLRNSLYVKDDDWRLSYLQGTYITTTNLKENDWERITALHPSPLYISLHATDSTVREKMLNNKNAGKILENLKRFQEIGIELHLQIVLCPNYNDGEILKKTLLDLIPFKKNIKSIAIVPVGISKYRKDYIKPVDYDIALQTIKIVEDFNKTIKKNIAMVSDEFFLLTNYPIPDKKYYGEFAQIEDGVGTSRLFLDDVKKNIKHVKKKFKKPVKLSFFVSLSGIKIFEYIKENIKSENLEIEIVPVKNKFFGEKINVAGLITASDIIDILKEKDFENIILPSLMFKEGTKEFLDGLTLDDVKKYTNANIFINNNCYNFSDILTIINSF